MLDQSECAEELFRRDLEIAARESDLTLEIRRVSKADQLPEQRTLALVVLPSRLGWGKGGEEGRIVVQFGLEASTLTPEGPRRFRNNVIFLAPGKTHGSRATGNIPDTHAALFRVKPDGTEPVIISATPETSAKELVTLAWD